MIIIKHSNGIIAYQIPKKYTGIVKKWYRDNTRSYLSTITNEIHNGTNIVFKYN